MHPSRDTRYLGYSTTAFYFYNLCDCIGPGPIDPKSGKPSAHNRKVCASADHTSPIPAEFLTRSAQPGKCDSYEDTLLAVDGALRAQGIPIQHYLLDSWWYGEGIYGGVSLWEDEPECVGMNGSGSFPRGLHAFQARVNKTIWVHNGRWTSDSPYREKYPFVPDGAPQGPELWDHLFKANHDGWNLGTIKQDHIGEQMGATKTVRACFERWPVCVCVWGAGGGGGRGGACVCACVRVCVCA
jgi:hypothetical protein